MKESPIHMSHMHDLRARSRDLAIKGPMHVVAQESLLVMLWRYRWIVLVSVVIALTIGVVYLVKVVPEYTSTSRLYVEQTGPKIMSEIEEGVMTRSKNYLYTQAELMRATPIITVALKQCQAEQMRTFADIDNPIGYLKESLNTSVGKKDDILLISFNSPYPTEAAQIVNAVVDAYITFHASRKRSTSLEVLKILQKEKAERGKELSEKLHNMLTFKQQHEELVFQTDQENLILDRLNRLSVALTDAQLTALESKSLYETSRNMIADANQLKQFVNAQRNQRQSWLNDPELERLKSKLDVLQQQRTDRLQKLNETHPAILALNAEIAKTKIQIAKRDEQYAQAQLTLIEQQYRTAEEKEDQLMQHFEQCRQEAVVLNRQLDQYAVLQSECDQTKKLCDILDDRIKELNITEDVGALNITILEVARAASEPSFPVRSKVMAIALIIGFMTGGAGALTRDMFSHRICKVDEVTDLIDSPILGMIPGMSRKLSLSERGQKIIHDSTSQAAEAFRTIRTSIFFSVPQDQARIIHVTSSFAEAGKSTLVSNLGIAMARSGQKVLILDGDFRKPVQHIIFGMDKDKGITAVLAGLRPLREVIFSTAVKGLDLLPCGPGVMNPAEMLGSARFKAVLERLKTRYDRILVDSPPVIPVSDASILAAVCDATVLIVRLGKTKHKSLLQCREIIMRVGGRIIGCVVNDVSSRGTGYSDYGYGYGYGNKHQKPEDNRNGQLIIHKGISRLMNAESQVRKKKA